MQNVNILAHWITTHITFVQTKSVQFHFILKTGAKNFSFYLALKPNRANEAKIALKTFSNRNGVSHFAEASCCSNFKRFFSLWLLCVYMCTSLCMSNTKRNSHTPTIWWMCVYALFAIVSWIIWKCRHVFISGWVRIANELEYMCVHECVCQSFSISGLPTSQNSILHQHVFIHLAQNTSR